MTAVAVADRNIEEFIARWQGLQGGRERANYALFLIELAEALGVERPAPSDSRRRDYAFERTVTFREPDGTSSTGFIDLYKKGCIVLQAKQSRQKDGKKTVPGQADLFPPEEDNTNLGRRTADRNWDTLMLNARQQAADYARALEPREGWPPFLIVCDVGNCFEIFADFTGQGKNYQQFPDRNGFRIYLEELRNPAIVKRLAAIWTDPRALDPAAHSAKVTREIAGRLAAVSKALEARKHNAEDVVFFLMRCLFTMFAEDVQLLPVGCFKRWLEAAASNKDRFKHELTQLWRAMDKGGYATIAEARVKKFNGSFFRSASVPDLEREEIGELLAAAKYNWTEVDPAIFGTLLEQALSDKERARLGAHYTPRAYVERLVVVTVLEPLRQEWARVQATAERLKEEKRAKEAKAAVQAFHDKLCATRVLDPACGTGNFLYVALELMKRLEGEVLEALVDLGGQEALKGLEGHTIDPHQFLGLEKKPPRRGHRGIGDLARLPAVALPHQGRRPVRADPARLQEHHRDGRGADVGPLPGNHVRGEGRQPRRDLPQRPPPRLARRRVRRRQSAVHWRQGHPCGTRRRVHRDALARAQPHQRQRRPRHVLVGPRC